MSERYPGGFLTGDTPAVSPDSATGVWTLEQQAGYQGQGEWPTAGFKIERSLRFNSADSTYLSRTPASAGNRKTWTWSGWLKRSVTGTFQCFFGAGTGVAGDTNWFGFLSDELAYADNDGGVFITSTSVFLDTAAWYHIVLTYDSTQATAADRVKIYVNGVETPYDTTTYPTQNLDSQINATSLHVLGARYRTAVSEYFNGYITEVNFIDGQALTPSSFGQTNSVTGAWGPQEYKGTYGTNGFYVNFSDNSGVTAATLGADYSGNGNNWTPNNFSVTAGSGNDSFVDVPTNYGLDTGAGGEVRGNYCTLDPLPSNGTISNGNLQVVTPTTAVALTRGTIAIPQSGKWYYEVTAVTNANIGYVYVGSSAANLPDSVLYAGSNGDKRIDGTFSAYGSAWSNGDVIGVAVNVDDSEINFYRNGENQGTISYTFIGKTMFPAIGDQSTSLSFTAVLNFGQRPFAYTAPSGFKALCSTNLPAPIINGRDYFNPVLYTGNGGSNAITGVGFQPDFVWLKSRSAVFSHNLYDAIRGVNKALFTDGTTAETTYTDRLMSFDTDGFTLSSSAGVNGNTTTYASWNWNAGGTTVLNNDGTVAAFNRVNPTSGFSIVSFSGVGPGTSSNEITVGHGLGVAPKVVIVKRRDSTSNWLLMTTAIDGSNDALYLDLTNAATAIASDVATSSVFSTGGTFNASGATSIAYCFAEVEGYCKISNYTGNGSTSGPFVYCGFRPAFVLIKRTQGVSNWWIEDTQRNPYNTLGNLIVTDSNTTEFTGTAYNVDFLSSGFRPRNISNGTNVLNETYFFMAFAENPFKYSLAR